MIYLRHIPPGATHAERAHPPRHRAPRLRGLHAGAHVQHGQRTGKKRSSSLVEL